MANHVHKIPSILHLCPDYIVVDKPFDTPINSDDPHMVSVETLLSKYYPHLRDPSVKHGFRLDVLLAFKIFIFVFYSNPFFLNLVCCHLYLLDTVFNLCGFCGWVDHKDQFKS